MTPQDIEYLTVIYGITSVEASRTYDGAGSTNVENITTTRTYTNARTHTCADTRRIIIPKYPA
jgi:hypothetical protein